MKIYVKNIILPPLLLVVFVISLIVINGCGGSASFTPPEPEKAFSFIDKSANVPVTQATWGSYTGARTVVANTIYLSWTDCGMTDQGCVPSNFYVAESVDGGEVFSRSSNMSPTGFRLPLSMVKDMGGDLVLLNTYVPGVDMWTSSVLRVSGISSSSEIVIPPLPNTKQFLAGDMAMDSNGVIYMAITLLHNSDDEKLHLYKLPSGASEFTYVGEVADQAFGTGDYAAIFDFPSIAIDANNIVYMSYRKYSAKPEPGVPASIVMKTYDGSSFSSEQPVSSTNSFFTNSRLAFDSAGNLHAIWWGIATTIESCANVNIYHASKAQGASSFAGESPIADAGTICYGSTATIGSDLNYIPALVIDSKDIIYVGYISNVDSVSNITVLRSKDLGATWTSLNASATSGVDYILEFILPLLSMAVDEADNVYVLGALQRSVGGPWELVFSIGAERAVE